MADLVDRYAADLTEYAKNENLLEEFYTHALILTQRSDWSDLPDTPEKLNDFLQLMSEGDRKAVLSKFIDAAREHFGLLDVTVISAAPLTEPQRVKIESKLTDYFDKQIHMITKVDPSLLGGLCIVAGYTVIDNSIKKKLSDLKKSVYKGVYFK